MATYPLRLAGWEHRSIIGVEPVEQPGINLQANAPNPRDDVQSQVPRVGLEEDVPPIDTHVRGTERRIVQPLGGVNDRLPGETGTFAVDLVDGRRYAFICYAIGPDQVAHSQKE